MFKFGSLGCKMLIIGLIVVLLAGVFGVVTGPPIREEIRTQQYHGWALEFEETWNCIDIVGISEQTEGYLEIYLRGKDGPCTLDAGDAFYATDIFTLEKISERLGRPVDYVIILFASEHESDLTASEYIITHMGLNQSITTPGIYTVPEHLNLWKGRGE